jgi:hypothetical protein
MSHTQIITSTTNLESCTNVQLFTHLYVKYNLTTLNYHYNIPNVCCRHIQKHNLIILINLLKNKNCALNCTLTHNYYKLNKSQIAQLLSDKFNFKFNNCELNYIDKVTFLIILNNLTK